MTTTTAPLEVGTKAPDFSLPATNAEGNVSLSDYKGQNLILVFYPKDSTPGCTKQLCALRDDLDMFKNMETRVIASNPGSMESHQRFCEKQGYQFPILVDAEKTMAENYHALKEGGGIQRTVYIIDGNGVIRFSQQGMPSDEELAEAIKNF